MCELLTAISTGVSSIAIICSIVVLWWQLTQLRRSVMSSSYHSVYATMVEIDRFFIEHSAWKPYFYDGKDLPGDPKEAAEIMTVAEMLADYLDNVYHQQACMPPKTFAGFSHYMRTLFRCSPCFREYLQSHQEWYPVAFIQHLAQDWEGGRPVPGGPAKLHLDGRPSPSSDSTDP